MKPVLVLALLGVAFPLFAQAAGYAVHGTYVDYGSLQPRRMPAVLFVSIHGREARVRLDAPGARCVAEFGASTYVGPALGGGEDTLAIHVDPKSSCTRNADDARVFLRFQRGFPRGVSHVELTERLRGKNGALLFEAN